MEPVRVGIVSLPEKKSRALLFSVDLPSQKGLLCRSSQGRKHQVLTEIEARLLDLRTRLPVAFFLLFT